VCLLNFASDLPKFNQQLIWFWLWSGRACEYSYFVHTSDFAAVENVVREAKKNTSVSVRTLYLEITLQKTITTTPVFVRSEITDVAIFTFRLNLQQRIQGELLFTLTSSKTWQVI
jgi:hypothetical protein